MVIFKFKHTDIWMSDIAIKVLCRKIKKSQYKFEIVLRS